MRKRLFSSVVLMVFIVAASVRLFGESTEGVPAPAAVAQHHESEHHESIGQRIATALRKSGLPDPLVWVAISTLPIVELRGAVPAGHILMDVPSMDPAGKVKASIWIYVTCVLGNMIPVPFILLLLGPISRFCMRFKVGKWFFDWLFARTRRKTANIEKYETLGLTVFVAIPLPVTGAWTGSMAAFLLGLSFKHAMVSILLGVMIAGVIMTVLSLMGWIGAAVAGVVLIGLAVSGMAGWLKREEKQDGDST